MIDSFPASAAFDAIQSSLQSDDAGRKDAIKDGKAVFAFILKNKAGQTQSWHIDLKDKGEVRKGEAPDANGGLLPSPGVLVRLGHASYWSPRYPMARSCARFGERRQLTSPFHVVTLSLSDEDFGKLVAGKTQAQLLFMSGKLKIKGDVMKATKMEPILKKAQIKAKL